MKIRRYKKVNKSISFFVNNFNFRKPYQLLVDGTFCFAALNNQVNISDNIPRYLQSELKLLTTQCVIMETEKLGSNLTGALIILKQYVIHKCGHEGKPVPASKCLLSMLGKNNNAHYIIATQDRSLQDKIRQIPGVPLLYLYQKTPVLDPPSSATIAAADNKLDNQCMEQISVINKLKVNNGIIEEKEGVMFKKRKKKGPNPLSCKKKKKPKQTQPITKSKETTKSEIDKKKRKKVHIPKHVKESLLKK